MRILLLMLCLGSGLVTAEQQQVHLKFVSSHFAGISELKEQDGKTVAQGLGVDIVNKIAQMLAIKIDIEILPFKRALISMENKKYDAIFGVYKKADREQYLDFIEVVFFVDSYLFYGNAASELHWDGKMSHFPQNAKLGWITGWSYFDELYAMKDQLNTIQVNSLASTLKMLHKGRLDLAVGPIRDINPLISKLGLGSGLKLLSAGHGETGNYIAFSKGNKKALQLKVREALIKILKMPWYQQRLKHYQLQSIY